MAMAARKGMTETGLWPQLRDYWLPVAFSDEVGEKPLAVRLLDERLALCRLGARGGHGGEVAAFLDLCVHRGTPISLGWIEGEEVVCAYHGWSYNREGRCTRIPSVPSGHPIPKKACLTRYKARERYGIVWVCLGEPRAPLPEYPPLEDPEFQVIFRDKRRWACSAARAIENFFDFGHFAWVHEGILGDRDHPIPPQVTLEREGEELRFWADRSVDSTHAVHSVSHRNHYIVTRPFSIHQWKEEPGGNIEAFIYVVTPVSAGECQRFMFTVRNYEGGPHAGDSHADLQNLVAEQDRVIVENQRPEELPLDLAEELHIKGPDAAALAYRRFLGELGVE
jgi:phenylpropionate dioxygenase-like ring-hydroxylating dioxygenase large terminal subunit